jgi:antitoxin VapB
MTTNIEDSEVDRLIEEIATLTGESKSEVIRKALEERLRRLAHWIPKGGRAERLRRFLEQEVWPTVSREKLGRNLTTEEEDSILGYGDDGV